MRYEKIDPALLRVWRDYKRGDSGRLARHVELWEVLLPEDGDEPVRVVVSLHCDRDAVEQFDPRWGVRASGENGSTRSATVPLEYVEALTEHPAVSRLVLSKRHRLV